MLNLRRFSIFQRFAMLVGIVIFGLIVLSVSSLNNQYKALKYEQYLKTQNVVEEVKDTTKTNDELMEDCGWVLDSAHDDLDNFQLGLTRKIINKAAARAATKDMWS